MTRRLIVGLGSPHGDDSVGWKVADTLLSLRIAETLVRRAHVPLDLLDWIHESDDLILCDALVSPDHSGQVQHWKWPDPLFAQCTAAGSHDYGLPQVLELAATLGRLPSRVTLWTISVADHGEGMPDSIRDAAIESIVKSICLEIETSCGTQPTGNAPKN